MYLCIILITNDLELLFIFRSPFLSDKEYIDTKTSLLELGFEMATSAHRGIFSEKPVRTIRSICEKLVKIADHIIQVCCFRSINLYTITVN